MYLDKRFTGDLDLDLDAPLDFGVEGDRYLMCDLLRGSCLLDDRGCLGDLERDRLCGDNDRDRLADLGEGDLLDLLDGDLDLILDLLDRDLDLLRDLCLDT